MRKKETREQWQAALRAYRDQCRQASPIPPRGQLTAEEEWHCRIIGGSVIRFLESRWSTISGERKFFAWEFTAPGSGVVVFTTTMPGLVAVTELFERPVEAFIALLNDEWTRWIDEHPDPEFQYHAAFWSYFTATLREEERERVVREFPDLPLDQCRIHRVGDLWGPLAGTGADHLWRWDGETMRLVKERFREWIS